MEKCFNTRNRRIVGLDFSSTGKGGGPFVSNSSLKTSELQHDFVFKDIVYKTELGRFISLKRIWDLFKQIRYSKANIIHCSGLGLMGFHMVLAARLARKRVLLTVHGMSEDALNINFFKKALLSFILEPITLLLCHKFYGVSRFVADKPLLNKFLSKHCGFVYNMPPYQTKIVSNFRKELNLKDNEIVVTTVGRVIKDKGFHILVDAIQRFESSNKIKFVIVGEGDYLHEFKDRLKEMISNEKVYCLGYRSDIQEILIGSDIFVLPTLHETLSIALLEASVNKLPLIASDTGGVPEIVENGVNGFLVTPGNSDSLYSAISNLINKPELRNKFGLNAKNVVDSKFDHGKICDRIRSIYLNLLE